MKNQFSARTYLALLLLLSTVFAFTGCQWLCRNFNLGCPPQPAFVCEPPTNIGIENMVKNGDDYTLSYAWTPSGNANNYNYQFFINGQVQQRGNTDGVPRVTVKVTTANIRDILEIRVTSSCVQDTNQLESEPAVFKMMFMNTVATDDVVFRVNKETPLDTLLRRVCEADSTGCTVVLFEEGFIRNAQGDTAVVIGPYEKYKYYDILQLKNCLCPPTGSEIGRAHV